VHGMNASNPARTPWGKIPSSAWSLANLRALAVRRKPLVFAADAGCPMGAAFSGLSTFSTLMAILPGAPLHIEPFRTQVRPSR
jgi:hypothetical protein